METGRSKFGLGVVLLLFVFMNGIVAECCKRCRDGNCGMSETATD